jgi:hypothetical protein
MLRSASRLLQHDRLNSSYPYAAIRLSRPSSKDPSKYQTYCTRARQEASPGKTILTICDLDGDRRGIRNQIRLVQHNGRIDRVGIPHTEIAIYNMSPKEELEALHHYPVRKSVAAATATSRRTENMRESLVNNRRAVS